MTLVYRRPEGTDYVAADVVWRARPYAEPPEATNTGAGAGLGAGTAPSDPPAARAEFPPALDPRLVTLVADTPTATPAAVADAPHYAVRAYHPAGIAMNRWVVKLVRIR